MNRARDDLERVLRASFPALALPRPALPELERRCRIQRLGRGAAAFVQGEISPGLFGVITGEIEIRFATVAGEISVVEHVTAHGLFGLSSFAAATPSRYDAVAVRPTRLAVFGASAYEYLMDQVPGFARALMRELARRHGDTLALLEASRHRTAGERLALALAHLVQVGRGGSRDARGQLLVRASQSELAALANLSRQTVNQLLAQLARQRRARPVYGGVWIATDWLDGARLVGANR